MLVEHARNLVGIADAIHAEYNTPGTPIVTLLACSLQDTSIDVTFPAGSRLHAIHGRPTSRERATCSYGLGPAFTPITAQHGMAISALDSGGEIRAIERVNHPFFIATLYQPQLSSAPGNPHPIWTAFVQAVLA